MKPGDWETGVDEVFYAFLGCDFLGAEGPVEFLWFAKGEGVCVEEDGVLPSEDETKA